jgi:hypothetical protein
MRAWPLLFLSLLAPEVSAQNLHDDALDEGSLEELRRLRARVEALEGRETVPGGHSIDLSGDELPALQASTNHVLSRPWYENAELHGYGAMTYLDSGGTGTTPDGSFLIRESSLFLEMQLWEGITLFNEVWLRRYLFGNGITLGEIYLQHRDVFGLGPEHAIGLKAGRFEIPFGEDYLLWDAHESPLINFAAADPYGIDEGVELYGRVGPVGWIGALTNGGGGVNDENPGKQGAVKLYGRPYRDVYLSGSVLSTGDTAGSDFRLSGNPLQPVAGSSSTSIEARLWELDVHVAEERPVSLALQYGSGTIDDEDDAFDRSLSWYSVMPRVHVRSDLEVVVRLSAIGTFDGDEGYRFSGKHVADAQTLGFDTRSLTRLSTGLCWKINPNLALKVEVGKDRIELVNGSVLDEENDERMFFGVELVGSF